MKTTTKLTKEEMETLVLYLHCFQHGYYLAMGKKLETVEQILEVVESGKFTFEDIFWTHLDAVLMINSDEGDYWDDHMNMFDYENYFSGKKSVGDGSWIKIRTENGFEVHYAKMSTRKRRFEEEITTAYKKLDSLLRKEIKHIADNKHDNPKIKKAEDKVLMLRTYSIIGIKPYEVFIKRSKAVTEYYMPYQYEIVDDITDFSEACMQGTVGIKIKALFSAEQEEKIFYLMSRGISEGMARIMASLNQSYFCVNMNEMINEYNQQLSKAIKIN